MWLHQAISSPLFLLFGLLSVHHHHTAALSSAIVAADATNVLSTAASLDHRLLSGRHGE